MIVPDGDFRQKIERWLALAADAGGRVRVGFPGWLRPFVQKGVIAITLGRTVYLSEGLVERGEDEVTRIVRHELAHVRQVMRLGLVRFLWGYVSEYLRNRRKKMSKFEAYEAISFEVEARKAEEEGGPERV